MSLPILRFELRYLLRQPSSRAVAAALLLVGVGLSQVSLGGEGVAASAPHSVALNLGLLSLLSVFAVAVLVAGTVLRDRQTGMEELVRATPPPERTLARHALVGVAAGSLVLMWLPVAGTWAVHALTGSGGVPGPGRYLSVYALIVVPNTLLLVSLLFLVARASGRSLSVYLGALGLYLGYFGISVLAGSPLIAGSGPVGSLFAGALADPFGLLGLLEQARGWTDAQMNARSLAWEGPLLYNRILCSGAAALAGRAAVRLPGVGTRSRKAASPGTREFVPDRAAEYRPVAPDPAGWRRALVSAVSGTRLKLTTHLRSVPALVIGILWVALAAMSVSEAVADGPAFFDTPFQPLTGLVVPALLTPFATLGSLVLIFWAGELAWSDRSAGMHHLADATPASDRARFGSTALALALLSLALASLLAATGIAYQVLKGGTPDLSAYTSLVYVLGVPWLLAGLLAAGVQSFVPDRHVGTLVTAFLVVLWRPISVNALDLDFPLIHVGWTPPLDYSVFAGFGPFLEAFHGWVLYWALLALVLGLLAVRAARRGIDEGVRARVRRLGADLRSLAFGPVGAGSFAFLAAGAFVLVGTVDQGDLVSEGQVELWRAEYERRLSSLATRPRPVVEGVELAVHLHPDDRRYQVTGSYRLVNRTGDPVDSLLVGWNRWISNRSVTLDGAEPALEYRPFNHVLFAPVDPIAPGASARLEFEMEVGQSGFGDYDPDHSVVADGSFVRLERFLPRLGYDATLELTDPEIRREQGLYGPGGEGAAPPLARGTGRARVRLTASAPAGHRVAAPGELTRNWTEGGRTFFRFESDAPTRRRHGIASAAWEESFSTAETPTGEVEVRVLHHPRHGRNAPLVADAARTSLETLSEMYGPYGRRSLTVAEIPSYHEGGVQATSYPGVLFMREHGGWTGDFRGVDADELNYLHRRVAHEVAHEWWGHRLDPDRSVPGASVLTESLAEYSAALVQKRRFGEEAFRAQMAWDLEQYLALRGRIGGEEPALADVTPETDYVAYFKGPVVLNAIADLIGEEQLLAALGEFLARHAGVETRSATLDDLRAVLDEYVPERRHSLLDSWFEGTTTSDLPVSDVSIRRSGAVRRP